MRGHLQNRLDNRSAKLLQFTAIESNELSTVVGGNARVDFARRTGCAVGAFLLGTAGGVTSGPLGIAAGAAVGCAVGGGIADSLVKP